MNIYIYIYIYTYICIHTLDIHCKIKRHNHQVPKTVREPGIKQILRK